MVIGFHNYEQHVEKARTTQGSNLISQFTRLKKETIEEFELQWADERSQVEDCDSNKLMQKLLKPLEQIEEEVECSEVTTPASEAIDLTKKQSKKTNKDEEHQQTSIMSSHAAST